MLLHMGVVGGGAERVERSKCSVRGQCVSCSALKLPYNVFSIAGMTILIASYVKSMFIS